MENKFGYKNMITVPTNYRYMVHHMFRFISEIDRDLEKTFNGLKEKASINSNSDQAKN